MNDKIIAFKALKEVHFIDVARQKVILKCAIQTDFKTLYASHYAFEDDSLLLIQDNKIAKIPFPFHNLSEEVGINFYYDFEGVFKGFSID